MSKVFDAVVVGAGVSGLSTAICLQEAGWSVRILTADMPQDTVSNVAATSWYPYKAYPKDRLLGWSRRTYELFEELARDQNSGVYVREGVELLREPAPDPWWRDAVPDFRRCTGDELPPGYRDCYVFAQPVIEMPVYLGYLLDRFIAAGGRVEQRVLRSMEEATRIAQTVVNCTGLGARELVGDDQMTPIRGQIVRVSNPGLERCVADEGHPEGPRTSYCVRKIAFWAAPRRRVAGILRLIRRQRKGSCAVARRWNPGSRMRRCWSIRSGCDRAARRSVWNARISQMDRYASTTTATGEQA